MFYRIRLDLAFENLGVFAGLNGHALGILAQAHTINPGTLTEERGYLIVEECYHDEDPPKPCKIIGELFTS